MCAHLWDVAKHTQANNKNHQHTMCLRPSVYLTKLYVNLFLSSSSSLSFLSFLSNLFLSSRSADVSRCILTWPNASCQTGANTTGLMQAWRTIRARAKSRGFMQALTAVIHGFLSSGQLGCIKEDWMLVSSCRMVWRNVLTSRARVPVNRTSTCNIYLC